MKKHLLLIICIFSLSQVHSLELGLAKEDAGHAGSFLDFAASARSLGMGRAHTAVADDAGATYWNPAGLTQLQQNDLVTLYSILEDDTSFGFISYARPFSTIGSLGIGFVTLNSDDFEKRGGNGEALGNAKLSEMAVLASHAFNFGRRWSWGTTFKGVQQKIDINSDTSFGADTGLMMEMGYKWQAGLTIKNLIAPKLTLNRDSEKLSRDIRLGLKWTPNDRLLIASDFNQTEDRSIKFHLGTEWAPHPLLRLRAGLNETEITGGMGFQWNDLGLDYAFGYNSAVTGVENLGATHRFGLNYKFGRKVEDLRAETIRKKYEREGELILRQVRKLLNSNSNIFPAEIKQISKKVKSIVKERGFSNPADLYEAQGYVYFLEKKYTQSVYYIGEALNITDGSGIGLRLNYEKALSHMNEEQKTAEIERLVKQGTEYYNKREWRLAQKTLERALLIDGANNEARTLVEIAKRHMDEPIEKAMLNGRNSMGKGAYLDAIRYYSQVRAMDPSNKDAERAIKKAIAILEKTQAKRQLGRKVQPVEKNAVKSRKYYSAGLELYSEGKLTEALSAWEKAIRLDHNNNAAINARNRALSELSRSR